MLSISSAEYRDRKNCREMMEQFVLRVTGADQLTCSYAKCLDYIFSKELYLQIEMYPNVLDEARIKKIDEQGDF